MALSRKRGHEFEREQKDVWESQEGKNGRIKYCDWIIISKINEVRREFEREIVELEKNW